MRDTRVTAASSIAASTQEVTYALSALDRQTLDVQKATVEAEIERIRQDYTKAAKSVTRKAGPLPFITALLLIVVGIVPLVNHKSDIVAGIPFFMGMAQIAMGFVAYVYMVNGVANRSLAAAEKSRLGFREFYKSYLSAQSSYLSAQTRADAAWNKQMAGDYLEQL